MPRKTRAQSDARLMRYGFNEAAARCRGKHANSVLVPPGLLCTLQ